MVSKIPQNTDKRPDFPIRRLVLCSRCIFKLLVLQKRTWVEGIAASSPSFPASAKEPRTPHFPAVLGKLPKKPSAWFETLEIAFHGCTALGDEPKGKFQECRMSSLANINQ